MFFLSQVVLNKFKLCDTNNLSSYSIATGIALYGALYLYFLYYNEELLSIFNKFMIYVISVDLLLSTFYFYQINTKGIEHNLNENCETSEEEIDSELDSQLTEEEDEDEDEDEDEKDEDNEDDDDHELHEEYENESEKSYTQDSVNLDNSNGKNENNIEEFQQQENHQDETEGTDVILNEAENLIKNNLPELNEKNNTILLMEDRVEIKPRRRRKATVLQV